MEWIHKTLVSRINEQQRLASAVGLVSAFWPYIVTSQGYYVLFSANTFCPFRAHIMALWFSKTACVLGGRIKSAWQVDALEFFHLWSLSLMAWGCSRTGKHDFQLIVRKYVCLSNTNNLRKLFLTWKIGMQQKLLLLFSGIVYSRRQYRHGGDFLMDVADS